MVVQEECQLAHSCPSLVVVPYKCRSSEGWTPRAKKTTRIDEDHEFMMSNESNCAVAKSLGVILVDASANGVDIKYGLGV